MYVALHETPRIATELLAGVQFTGLSTAQAVAAMRVLQAC